MRIPIRLAPRLLLAGLLVSTLWSAAVHAGPEGVWAELLFDRAVRQALTATPEGVDIARVILGRPLRSAGEIPYLIDAAAVHPDRHLINTLEERLSRLSKEFHQKAGGETPEPGNRFGLTEHQAFWVSSLSRDFLHIRRLAGEAVEFLPAAVTPTALPASMEEFVGEGASEALRSSQSPLREQLLNAPMGHWEDPLSDLASLEDCSELARKLGIAHPGAPDAVRFDLLKDFPIADLTAAPGHRVLRKPGQVARLAEYIRSSGGGDFSHDPILINLVTAGDGQVLSVDLWNAHHRLVAYLKAGYTNLGQIPAKNFRILINGETAWGSLWTHYVPAAGLELEAFPHAPEAPVGGDVRPATLQVPGRLTSFDLGSRNTVGQLLKNFERAGKPKVGVFFGTFDPIHEGHMRVIRQAMQAAGLDEVVIVPNFTAGHKPGATSVARRIAMLAARVAGESHMNVYTGDSSLLVDRFTRAPLMERIKQIYGTDNLVQVVGQDSFEKSVADHLIDPAAHRWLVFPRVVGHPISIPEELKPIVDVAPFPDDTALSSTAIREAFATGHIPAADRVHPAVTRYILATGLYRPH